MTRACCCVGYLTNPGGKCCMDVTPADYVGGTGRTIATDKIVIDWGSGNIGPHVLEPGVLTPVPERVAVTQGWQCPLCKTVYAPHIDVCECGVNE